LPFVFGDPLVDIHGLVALTFHSSPELKEPAERGAGFPYEQRTDGPQEATQGHVGRVCGFAAPAGSSGGDGPAGPRNPVRRAPCGGRR
jgi:hypothetical protein